MGFTMAPLCGGGQFALWLPLFLFIKVPSSFIAHLVSGTGSRLGLPTSFPSMPHPSYRDRRPRIGGGRSTLLRGVGEEGDFKLIT